MKLAASLWLTAAVMLYTAASSATPICSVEIHPRFNLYVVNVDGRPFKNKHYVDYDDAALLHRVLVDSGQCVPAQRVAKCDPRGEAESGHVVRLAGAGRVREPATGAAQLGWSPTDCSAQ